MTAGLDMLVFGLVIPVLPHPVLGFAGGDAAQTVRVLGLLGTGWAAMQLLAMPLVGAVSHRFGRRPVVVLSNLGTGLDYLLMAVTPNLSLLFLGHLISGVTSASVRSVFAYVADVLPPERRARGFGLLGIGFGLGFVFGPAAGGLLGKVDPRLPFRGGERPVLAELLLRPAGAARIPAADAAEPPRPAPGQSTRRAGHAARAARPARPCRVHLPVQLAHVVLPSITMFYATTRYGWDASTMGLALALAGLCSALAPGALDGLVMARLGRRRVLALGLAAGTAGFLGFGLAPSGAWFLAALPMVALLRLAGPSLQALLSRQVGAEGQGRLQGAASSVQGIAALVGSSLFAGSFALAIEGGWGLPGAPYLLAAALLAAGGLLGRRVTRDSGDGTA